MNNIRQIQELNKRELESGVSPDASWHADYRDTAYIYIGGLPYELSEGDIITIFSQFGEPTYVDLVRDEETGKSKGFAFLKYEDQRSTELAVDNLGGTTIINRIIRVDHTRYKKKYDDGLDGLDKTVTGSTGEVDQHDGQQRDIQLDNGEHAAKEAMFKEELELTAIIRDHDGDDPMKSFLIEEKKDQIKAALAKLKGAKTPGSDPRTRRNHSRPHGSHRTNDREDREVKKTGSHRYRDEHRRRRSRTRD